MWCVISIIIFIYAEFDWEENIMIPSSVNFLFVDEAESLALAFFFFGGDSSKELQLQ